MEGNVGIALLHLLRLDKTPKFPSVTKFVNYCQRHRNETEVFMATVLKFHCNHHILSFWV